MPPEASNPTNSALADEIEAINSIYGAETLSVASGEKNSNHAILRFPEQPFSFILTFAPDYPHSPPLVDGTESTRTSSKGEGTAAAKTLREVITRVWSPGEVCLFDVIEEVGSQLPGHGESESANDEESEERSAEPSANPRKEAEDNDLSIASKLSLPAPNWTVSEPITEKKSVFVARCAPVTNKDAASASVSHLLATSKKIASATHNITAWRIQSPETGIIVQDCDDDGETAAGGRLLHLMQVMDVWNAVVVVTRWYGGTKLGPDRFRIINSAARDALVKGGFVKRGEEKGHEKENRGKKKGKK